MCTSVNLQGSVKFVRRVQSIVHNVLLHTKQYRGIFKVLCLYESYFSPVA